MSILIKLIWIITLLFMNDTSAVHRPSTNNYHEQSPPINRDYDEPPLPNHDYDHRDVLRRQPTNGPLPDRDRYPPHNHANQLDDTAPPAPPIGEDSAGTSLPSNDAYHSRHRPSDLHKEALRHDYARPSAEHRMPPVSVPPPAPYPYAPVPMPMSSYSSSYEPRSYGSTSGHSMNSYSPYEYPPMSSMTANPYPYSHPMHAFSHHQQHQQHQQQQQQLQNALSSLVARNSFLGFIDPIIVLAIVAVPVITMLGLGSLIMPFIPVIIYVLNIFFPVGGSGRKRNRRHLHSRPSSLLFKIDANKRLQAERLYQQLRNATTKFS
jgi:hypothetical protein